MNITLNIERLILNGLAISKHQHSQLQSLIEKELARLLAADCLAPELRFKASKRRIIGGGIQLNNGEDILNLGIKIAQTVHRGIRQ